jgi:hypothetical protein
LLTKLCPRPELCLLLEPAGVERVATLAFMLPVGLKLANGGAGTA